LSYGQDSAQVVSKAFKDAGFQPSLRPLVDDRPRGKSCGIIGQEAPARTKQRKALKTSRKE
jgi:hypothetical protein